MNPNGWIKPGAAAVWLPGNLPCRVVEGGGEGYSRIVLHDGSGFGAVLPSQLREPTKKERAEINLDIPWGEAK